MDVDYLAFVAERVSQLRAAKGVSANDMSLSIGQSRNYIRHLEKREIVPSLQVLFFICDYFKISPQEFFEQGNRHIPHRPAGACDSRGLEGGILSFDGCLHLVQKKAAKADFLK